MIRDIPFRYAPGGITVSIHQLTQGAPPPALMTADFDEDRAAFKRLGPELRKQSRTGRQARSRDRQEGPRSDQCGRSQGRQDPAQEHADRNAVDKYLKALHGLIAMLQTPRSRSSSRAWRNTPR